ILPVATSATALPTAASATVATDSHSQAAAPVPAAGRCTDAGLPAFRARRGAAGAAWLVIKVPRFTGRGRTEEQGFIRQRSGLGTPARAIPEWSGVHLADLGRDLLIADRPRRGRPGPRRVVGARGDRDISAGQHRADRLDPERVPVLLDVVHDQREGRSSAAAKKTDADSRIAFARRSSRTSRSSSPGRAASAVVVPGRAPASISAWVTQPHSVSGLIPSCSPIRRHALGRDAGSCRASNVIRIDRSRSSSGYFLGATIDVPPGLMVSIKPGTQQTLVGGGWWCPNRRQVVCAHGPGWRKLVKTGSGHALGDIGSSLGHGHCRCTSPSSTTMRSTSSRTSGCTITFGAAVASDARDRPARDWSDPRDQINPVRYLVWSRCSRIRTADCLLSEPERNRTSEE